MKPPTCGTSLHYSGDAGQSYFDYQETSGASSGVLDASKFAPHVRSDEVESLFRPHLVLTATTKRRMARRMWCAAATETFRIQKSA